ncbi:MAG TPA: prepilin-type N-terminal cleavage/methylation domain-containing protein [Gallionella sp.]|nr:prepilin-type N-terminal cleavage/methylation domain-containing protein [Gallionella sp.]
MRSHNHARGFTLVEMAIVLLIIGLLLGGLIPTLSAQMETQRISETRKQMSEIKDALFGYAVMHGRLPCPATTTDPANTSYGEADSSCANPASNNYLPWKTLGVAETDAWGSKWLYRVDPAFASATPFALTTSPSASLLIQNSAGITLTSSTEPPIAIVFSTGKNLSADGQNASFDATYQSDVPNPSFDDITAWISRPILFNRMVTAGKLP